MGGNELFVSTHERNQIFRKVRKTIYKHFRARFFRVIEKQVLVRLFASAVFSVVTPDKRRLNKRRKHYGAFVAVFFERV